MEGADPTTDLRCFAITIAFLSWPEEASDCCHVPAQGVRAAHSSVVLSPTHHIYCTILAEKLCSMISLIWQQPHNPYGSSRICTEEIQPQLKCHPYSIHLFLEEMEVSINDKEWLVQTICRKASFTLYLAAAHPCAIQQAKCYLLLFFYIYIYVHLTHHCSYLRASLLLSRSMSSLTWEQIKLCTGNCTPAQRSLNPFRLASVNRKWGVFLENQSFLTSTILLPFSFVIKYNKIGEAIQVCIN